MFSKQKMKFAGVALSVFGMAAIAQQRANFDFTKINAVLKEVLASVTAQHKEFKEFSVQIDSAATDPMKDTYKSNVQVVVDKAPWNNQVAEAAGSVGLRVRPDGAKGVEVAIDATAKTDTLSLLKYLKEKKNGKCDIPSSTQGMLRVLAKEDCKALEQVGAVKDVAGAKAVVVQHLADSKAALENYQRGLATDLGTIHDANLIDWIKRDQQFTASAIETINGAVVSDIQGGFRLTFKSFNHCEYLTVKNFTMEMTGATLRITGLLTTPLGEKIYDASKTERLKVMGALEQNKDFARELISIDGNIWLNLMASALAK